MDKLTKHERRTLKLQMGREQRKKALLQEEQKAKMKKIAFMALIIIVAGILVLFVFNWYNSLGDAPRIQLIPESYDFGQVTQAKGTVSAPLSVKNEGKSDLIINNIVSSCGCTTAVLIVDGIESPVFGMHSNYPGWSQKLLPGQTAELRVMYDPNVHRELRGVVTRTLTIHSNDPLNSSKKLTISAYQVD